MSMLGDFGPDAMGAAGTYEVTIYEEKHTIEADSLEFPPDGGLKVWKDGVVVGVFTWYSSVVRKP